MLFDTKSTGVAAERGVRSDHPVAGDDHWDGISSQGVADRTRRTRFTNFARDTGVRVDATERDSGCRLEHRALKGRHHAPIKGYIEASSLATKVFPQLRGSTLKNLSHRR